jgi:hypothetical protein
MKLFVIGTDHRLQQSIAPKPGGGWMTRTGGRKFLAASRIFLRSLGVLKIGADGIWFSVASGGRYPCRDF